MKWKTFDGRVVDTETASHQHISNFIHYHRIINFPDSYIEDHLEAISRRFDGVILPYKPLLRFKTEIRYLFTEGYLFYNPFSRVLYVIRNGILLGSLDLDNEENKEDVLNLEGFLLPEQNK